MHFDRRIVAAYSIPFWERHWGIGEKWGHMATEIWVNIGSGNGLLPDGTEPLPDPMLTYHQ